MALLADIIEDAKRCIDEWLSEANSKRTLNPFRAGLYDYASIQLSRGRFEVYDSDSEYAMARSVVKSAIGSDWISEEQIHSLLVPELSQYIEEQMRAYNLNDPTLLDYEFNFIGKFKIGSKKVETPLFSLKNEEKRELIIEQVDSYASQLLTIQALTDENKHFLSDEMQTLRLVEQLLNQDLYPIANASTIISVCEHIQLLNKQDPETLSKHRHWIVYALENWIRTYWIPTYIDKEVAPLQQADHELVELLLYTVKMISAYEPSYSKFKAKEYLEQAKQAGFTKANLYIKEGSGRFKQEDIVLQHELVQCKANDVFATIQIKIKEESEESYQQALQFITSLIEKGFPKSYQIKLTSSEKQLLRVKGLAKSGTHRFFANALAYPNLHHLLQDYAQLVMEQYEWYGDTEGEKCCMPGTYVVFGLGLLSARYHGLVQQYMKLVDEEHQSVQNEFVKAFIEQYGVTEDTVPVIVSCLLSATDSLKLKIKQDFEHVPVLQALVEQLVPLEDYEVEHIIYFIWGTREQFLKLIKKAKPEIQDFMQQLAQKI